MLSLAYSNVSVTLVAFAALIILFLARAIYLLFFSPLSAIPGPWYAAVSDFWILTHVLRLQQCKTVHELFEIYGPVVRIGPNRVVFKDLSTTKSVYSVHKFDKSVYYKSLLTNENDHAMTTLEHAPHSMRRKGYAPHYTPNNLAQFQPEMHDFAHDLVQTLNSISGEKSVDCLTLFRQFMVDVIVASSYGCRLGALKKWALGVEDALCTAISDFPKRGILRSAVPTWAWNLVCKIPNNRWRQMCDSDKIMAEFVSARVYELRAQMNAGKLHDSEKVPMLQRLLKYRYSSTGELMPDNDIISEAMGHMIAGSDTTSTTLSYFFWELSRRPDMMQKLRAELEEAMPDSMSIPDISVLQSLPYLNAFIKEGLRIYGAAPSLLERVVPSVSSKAGELEPFDLMGFALPAGTVVSTQVPVLEPQPRRHRLPFSGDIPARPLAGRGHQLDVGSPSSFRLRHQSLRWPKPCANHAQDRRCLHRQELRHRSSCRDQRSLHGDAGLFCHLPGRHVVPTHLHSPQQQL
ncbi:cytochrome P450, partial [Schizophyllum commune]